MRGCFELSKQLVPAPSNLHVSGASTGSPQRYIPRITVTFNMAKCEPLSPISATLLLTSTRCIASRGRGPGLLRRRPLADCADRTSATPARRPAARRTSGRSGRASKFGYDRLAHTTLEQKFETKEIHPMFYRLNSVTMLISRLGSMVSGHRTCEKAVHQRASHTAKLPKLTAAIDKKLP